jgi:hypothetical protein
VSDRAPVGTLGNQTSWVVGNRGEGADMIVLGSIKSVLNAQLSGAGTSLFTRGSFRRSTAWFLVSGGPPWCRKLFRHRHCLRHALALRRLRERQVPPRRPHPRVAAAHAGVGEEAQRGRAQCRFGCREHADADRDTQHHHSLEPASQSHQSRDRRTVRGIGSAFRCALSNNSPASSLQERFRLR